MEGFLIKIYEEAKAAATQLITDAKLTSGQIVVVGCSSSEVGGDKIGTHSSIEVAEAVFKGLYEVFSKNNIYIAAQCCEHLNRAIIIEREAATKWEDKIVNVVPQIKAGGGFATTAYKYFKDPVALEEVQADAGLDIGKTLIGMHLKKVAVPLRLNVTAIGYGTLIAARTRPKFIGGIRAHYDDNLL